VVHRGVDAASQSRVRQPRVSRVLEAAIYATRPAHLLSRDFIGEASSTRAGDSSKDRGTAQSGGDERMLLHCNPDRRRVPAVTKRDVLSRRTALPALRRPSSLRGFRGVVRAFGRDDGRLDPRCGCRPSRRQTELYTVGEAEAADQGPLGLKPQKICRAVFTGVTAEARNVAQ